MRTQGLSALVLLLVLACSGCTGSTTDDRITRPARAAAPAGGLQASPTSPASPCALEHEHDLIVWTTKPHAPAAAVLVSDVNPAACRLTVDEFRGTSPTGPGYCSVLARPADNPGYDPEAAPAPKPAVILQQYGPAC